MAKTKRDWCVAIVVCLGMGAAPGVGAQQQNVDFTVSGTSTIRGWTCTAKGTLAVQPGSGGGPAVPGFPNGVQSATLTVPVKGFNCPNAEMTEHLMQAMHPEKFADIVFKVEKYELAGTQAQTSGAMTIHGSTQPFSLPVTVKSSGAGASIEGSTRLDMTTYGVEPPVVMLGMLKVGPQIRIEFKGVVTP
jgi:hypothetical protein